MANSAAPQTPGTVRPQAQGLLADAAAVRATPPVWLLHSYCFLIFMEWSIIVPSIMDYLEALGDSDEEARSHYAFAQTGFALAQLGVSLLAGPLLLRVKHFLPLFAASSLLIIAGNILYALADHSALDSVPALLAGRVVAGLGAGGASVGMSFVSYVYRDHPKFIQIMGTYRTSGIVATVGGGFVASLFTAVDFRCKGFHVHAATLPGLFTAACFTVWLVLAAAMIRSKAESGGQKAYKFDAQVAVLFSLIFVSAFTGAALIYVMPIIMTHTFEWDAVYAGTTFTVATVFSLAGSCLGQSRRIVKFNAASRGFNAVPLLLSATFLMLLGTVMVWLGAVHSATPFSKYVFVCGTCVAMFAYSLVNTSVSGVVTLVFTRAEKIGMSPMQGVVLALSKVITPVMTAGEVALAGWHLAMGVWTGLVVLVLLLLLVQRSALAKE